MTRVRGWTGVVAALAFGLVAVFAAATAIGGDARDAARTAAIVAPLLAGAGRAGMRTGSLRGDAALVAAVAAAVAAVAALANGPADALHLGISGLIGGTVAAALVRGATALRARRSS